MDINELVQLYEVDRWTLRMIAEKYNTNHHTIRRLLVNAGVKITRRNTLKVFSQTHRDKISKACKGRTTWSKGKKMTREHTLKNMRAHLKYDVTFQWLDSFDDIEKLKYLNRSVTKLRDCVGFTTETYKQFIEKFYRDEKFNLLYNKWLITKDRWIKPSLDHIKARANGGTSALENLQFISWLENKAKGAIDATEWVTLKGKIHEYF